jgi:hypothetical protein
MQFDAVLASEQQAVSRIAGALAHELNNPLQGVLSLVSVALRESHLDERGQARLEQIHHGVSRLSRTVASLSAIYENLPRSPDLIPLTDLLNSLSGALAEQGFHVQMHPARTDRSVYCFSPELVRLMSDLFQEQAPDSETLHLSAWEDHMGAGFRCELGTHEADPDHGEWTSLEELNGVSGLAVLVDELVKLSEGSVEFRWNDSDLAGMRLWMRSA